MDKVILVGIGLGLAYLFFNKEQEEIKQEGNKKEVKHSVKIEDKDKSDNKSNKDKQEDKDEA